MRSERAYTQAALHLAASMLRVRAGPLAKCVQSIAQGFGTREKVEGRWVRRLVIKVAEPKFCSSKLPFLILVVLKTPMVQC